jgi:putative tricarboxylic transport membrane protein
MAWKDLTPIAMLALDEFILWVQADAPYANARAYVDAVKARPEPPFRMGGTGLKQEDQVLTVALQSFALPSLFTYVPYPSGGAVAKALRDKQVDSTVNNPIEALQDWRDGKVRPLCVFSTKRIAVTDKIVGGLAWSDIPTCKESGINVQYQMMRGIFASPGLGADQIAFYQDLFRKVMQTPEWKGYMREGAYVENFMTGEAFGKWLQEADDQHYDLMRAAGLLAPGKFRFLMKAN